MRALADGVVITQRIATALAAFVAADDRRVPPRWPDPAPGKSSLR